MSAVEDLDRWLALAIRLGYEVRYECLGNTSGGVCQIAGKKILFLDLNLTATEHLEQVQQALAGDPTFDATSLRKYIYPYRSSNITGNKAA